MIDIIMLIDMARGGLGDSLWVYMGIILGFVIHRQLYIIRLWLSTTRSQNGWQTLGTVPVCLHRKPSFLVGHHNMPAILIIMGNLPVFL